MDALQMILLVGAVAPPLNALREGNNPVLFTPFVSGCVFMALWAGGHVYVHVARVLSIVLAVLYYGTDPVKLTYKEEDLVRRVTTILPPTGSVLDFALWAALHAQHIGPVVLMVSAFEGKENHTNWFSPLAVGAFYVLVHESFEFVGGHPAYPLLRMSAADKGKFYVWCSVLTLGATWVCQLTLT